MDNKKTRFLSLIPLICIGILLLFPACSDANGPAKIELVENSFKTQYFIGEEVDLTGAKFVVTYEDGTTEEVGIDNQYIAVDTSFIQNTTAGKKDLTFIFNKQINKQVYVNVPIEFLSIDLVSIELKSETLPTHIKQNGILDLSLIQGTATYSNGKQEDIIAKQMDFTQIDTRVCGEHFITATFGGKTAMFSIIVDRLVIERITFSGGVFQEYSLNDAVSLESIIIQLELDDGSVVDLKGNNSNIKITGLNTNAVGEYEIVAIYVGEDYNLIDANLKGTHAYEVK